MADFEEDYMSEKILADCIENDVRPSLLCTEKEKYRHKVFKKKSESNKRSFTEMAREKTQEGLNTAIPKDNKGYELLMKMGYKEKEQGKNIIPLTLKTDNAGLGLNTEFLNKRKLTDSACEEYRQYVTKKIRSTHLKYDFMNIQRVCKDLDNRDDIDKPIQPWFWPPVEKTEEESSEDDHEESNDSDLIEKRLDIIYNYLRNKYYYCLWCGITFNDETSLAKDCPGTTREAHDS